MTNTRTVADIRTAIEARDPQVRDDYRILLDALDEATAQRDQARRLAVELENQNARLTDELATARAGDVDHLDADGEADDEPQVIARGLTMKEAMFRLMAHSTTDPENAVAYTKAADDERETATQAHATGDGS